jgi:hypothetical protein
MGRIRETRGSVQSEQMEVLRKAAASPETKDLIPVDSTGEPVWIPEIHGEFVVIVKSMEKGDGLAD